MKYTIKLDAELVMKNKFTPRFKKAQIVLDSEVLRDSAPFTPFRTGNLMNSGTRGTVLGSGKVVYNAPYARKCYYGTHIKFRKIKHPKATAEWFEHAKKLKLKAWVNGVNKVLGGEIKIG